MFGSPSLITDLGPNSGAISRMASAAQRDLRAPQGAGDFSSVLSAAGAQKARTPEQAAREAAEEFVAISLVEPILASLRESEGAAAPFAPGDAERSFRPLFDAEIARRMVKKSDFAVVEAVARRLLESVKGRGAPVSAPAAPGSRISEFDRHA